MRKNLRPFRRSEEQQQESLRGYWSESGGVEALKSLLTELENYPGDNRPAIEEIKGRLKAREDEVRGLESQLTSDGVNLEPS